MSAHTSQLDATAKVMLLFGDAETLKDRAIDQLLQDDSDADVTILEGRELPDKAQLAAELSGLSLYAPHRLVVIKRVDGMATDQQRDLAEVLQRLPDGTRVIMTAGEASRSKRPPVAAELAKVSKKLGQVRELSSPHAHSLPRWVAQETERLGKNISPQAAERVVELTGGQVDRIVSELEKIALYIGDAELIDEAAVEAVTSVSEEATIFQLVDAIGQRQPEAALKAVSPMLSGLTSKELSNRIGGILTMIARQLRLIWQARLAAQAGARVDRNQKLPDELAARFPEEHNLLSTIEHHDFLARKYTNQARNFTDPQLARALVKVYQTDLVRKGQTDQQLDPRLVLETLIVELCQM